MNPPERRRGRGRPPIDPNREGRSAQRTWIPEPGQTERLDRVAAALATSGNALIRRFVNEGLAREEEALGLPPLPAPPRS